MAPNILSERLRMLADMVTPGNRLVDVGCDHGYLSISLVGSGICPGAIAMDVREGPLAAAREHIAEYRLDDYIEARLSDGLAEYRLGEADTMVCAGMGGRLMERILREGMGKAREMRELILQPQSELPRFRAFLREAGFTVVDEEAVFEDGKYYFAMKAVYGREGYGTKGAGGETGVAVAGDETRVAIAGDRETGIHVTDKRPDAGNVTDGRAAAGNVVDGRPAVGNVTDGRPAAGNVTDGRTAAGNVADGRAAVGNVTDDRAAVGNVADGRPAVGNVTDGRAAVGNVADDVPASGNAGDAGSEISGSGSEAAAGLDGRYRLYDLYGELLLRKKHPVLLQYLTQRENYVGKLEESLASAGTCKAGRRLEEVRREMGCIKEALAFYAHV